MKRRWLHCWSVLMSCILKSQHNIFLNLWLTNFRPVSFSNRHPRDVECRYIRFNFLMSICALLRVKFRESIYQKEFDDNYKSLDNNLEKIYTSCICKISVFTNFWNVFENMQIENKFRSVSVNLIVWSVFVAFQEFIIRYW